MKKTLIISAVLLLTTSCSSANRFYDDIFGKEPYQPIPSSKRAPLLNNQAKTYPDRMQPPPQMGFDAMPQAPSPWAQPPMQPPMPPAYGGYAPQSQDIMRTPVPQLPQLDNMGLPANRRAPAMNAQGVAPVQQAQPWQPIPIQQPPMARPQIQPMPPMQPPMPEFADVTPPRPVSVAPPAWQPNEYPKLSQVPPAAQPPVPLRQDPRVQDLQRELNPDFVPPRLPPVAQYDETIPVPSKPVLRAPLPDFVDENEPVKPTTNFTKLKPIAPQAAPEPFAPVRPSVASTDYRQLRPISAAPSFAPRANYDVGVSNSTADILPPSRYSQRGKIYRYRGPAMSK